MQGGSQGFSDGDISKLIDMQMKANRVSTVTPFGSVTHQIDQGGPRNDNRVTVSLSPEQQAILEQQQLGQLLSGQLGAQRLGSMGDGSNVQQAVFDRGMSLLNPVFERREDQLRQRLANQGLPQSSGAFTRELGRFDTGVNQELERLAMSSVLAGSNEQTSELNRIMALLGRGQAILPQAQQVAPVNVPYNPPQQGASPLSGLLALGGAGLGGAFGGLPGAQFGFTAGGSAPGLFGWS